MTRTTPDAVFDAVMHEDQGRILARLIAEFRDFQAAEDALVLALRNWGRTGPP